MERPIILNLCYIWPRVRWPRSHQGRVWHTILEEYSRWAIILNVWYVWPRATMASQTSRKRPQRRRWASSLSSSWAPHPPILSKFQNEIQLCFSLGNFDYQPSLLTCPVPKIWSNANPTQIITGSHQTQHMIYQWEGDNVFCHTVMTNRNFPCFELEGCWKAKRRQHIILDW